MTELAEKELVALRQLYERVQFAMSCDHDKAFEILSAEIKKVDREIVSLYEAPFSMDYILTLFPKHQQRQVIGAVHRFNTEGASNAQMIDIVSDYVETK